jgi:ribosomal protein S27AE
VCKTCKNKDKVKSRDLHPVRYLARAKVNNALANGRITREPCEVCGDSVSQAHHDDYRKPMDVRWLCKPHHREWHKTNEAAE